jgi:cellulose synthase/poly-beta-1,6-N-acetylglucosamine synthase-like glycosyltransferase
MDLTWTIYQAGWGVRFIPEACSYPVEPESLAFMRKQLTRWSHAFVQNVRLHWGNIRSMRYLFSSVMVGFSDAVLASFVYLVILPILALLVTPWFLVGYVIDAPVIAVPVAVAAYQRREVLRAALSFPAFFVLRLVNGYLLLKAVFLEFVLHQSLTVYVKGH